MATQEGNQGQLRLPPVLRAPGVQGSGSKKKIVTIQTGVIKHQPGEVVTNIFTQFLHGGIYRSRSSTWTSPGSALPTVDCEWICVANLGLKRV